MYWISTKTTGPSILEILQKVLSAEKVFIEKKSSVLIPLSMI